MDEHQDLGQKYDSDDVYLQASRRAKLEAKQNKQMRARSVRGFLG